MKTVFSTSEVPHIWAKQSQDEGRNHGNLYFRKSEIYSYGSHFCLGNIINKGLVFLTNRSYSVSTSKFFEAAQDDQAGAGPSGEIDVDYKGQRAGN